MSLKYTITHEDSLIRVAVSGSPDYLSTDRLWHDIVARCKKENCFRVLGESATEEWRSEDSYDHAAIFEAAGVTQDYRVAWVEQNPDAKEAIKLAEAVIRNRGLDKARAFEDLADAKRWLDEKPVTPT